MRAGIASDPMVSEGLERIMARIGKGLGVKVK
jgi:hypothetical protein